MVTLEKIQGMLVGGAIGDAWGMAVEGWSPEHITKVHPEGVYCYKEPIGHKWFTEGMMSPGDITDDTFLTKATLVGIMNGNGFDMDSIAKAHVDALNENTTGWGRSTEEAIRRLANGSHWTESGKTHEKNRGTGNGIPMKCSPLAAWWVLSGEPNDLNFNQLLCDFAGMSHYTQMAACSGIIHAHAVASCLKSSVESFDVELDFLDIISDKIWEWGEGKGEDHLVYNVDQYKESEDNLEDRMLDLWQNREELSSWTSDKIRKRYGGGCYVYQTLPFSYAFFAGNPYSVSTVYDLIHAGGDTDTNAKIVLEMIGALHGVKLFHEDENKWMVDGLPIYKELMELGEKFYEQFSKKQES